MRLAALVALALTACVTAGAATPRQPAGVSIRLFRAEGVSGPIGITVGPDRALWFTNERSRSVGRITAAGSVSTSSARPAAVPGAISTGDDGALWFVDGSALARLTRAGVLTEYPVSSVVNIAKGPGNTIWFTTGGKYVGRMTAAGNVSVVSDSQRFRGTYGIARGPDGAMWVTNYLGSSIARIDATDAVTTFAAPCVRYPTGITAGRDGALWFTDDSGSIGRITTSGQITCFGDAAHVGHPDALVAGGDGALWAVDRGGSVVRMTRTGAITRYRTAAMRYPDAVAAGPGGTVWFTDYVASAVGRITSTGQPTKPARPRALPRVTFISDSVGASMVFDTGAKAILTGGVDLFLEPGQARTLGPGPPGGIAPPTVLELVSQLGRRLGNTVVIEVGNNDFANSYAMNVEAALTALSAAGVRHVLWSTLHVTPDHTSYATINDAIVAAAASHPELTVLDWNAYSASHPDWFQTDGVHLTGDGPRAFARFIHAGIMSTLHAAP